MRVIELNAIGLGGILAANKRRGRNACQIARASRIQNGCKPLSAAWNVPGIRRIQSAATMNSANVSTDVGLAY